MSETGQAALLLSWIAQAQVITGFTGAGISTESGIPDFRSPGGLWRTNMPVPFGEFVSSRAARAEAWRRKFTMDDHYRGAQPNQGHAALARLHAQGKMPKLITQNIDGLHQASGIAEADVIELHGNGTYAACLDCGARYELGWVRERFENTQAAPDCAACDGPVKSATISFGQAMPSGPMRHARAAALSCDLFLAIGSSLVVYPAAGFPLLAKRNGARLAIINREPTELDACADLVINAGIGGVLAPLARGDA